MLDRTVVSGWMDMLPPCPLFAGGKSSLSSSKLIGSREDIPVCTLQCYGQERFSQEARTAVGAGAACPPPPQRQHHLVASPVPPAQQAGDFATRFEFTQLAGTYSSAKQVAETCCILKPIHNKSAADCGNTGVLDTTFEVSQWGAPATVEDTAADAGDDDHGQHDEHRQNDDALAAVAHAAAAAAADAAQLVVVAGRLCAALPVQRHSGDHAQRLSRLARESLAMYLIRAHSTGSGQMKPAHARAQLHASTAPIVKERCRRRAHEKVPQQQRSPGVMARLSVSTVVTLLCTVAGQQHTSGPESGGAPATCSSRRRDALSAAACCSGCFRCSRCCFWAARPPRCRGAGHTWTCTSAAVRQRLRMRMAQPPRPSGNACCVSGCCRG